jgi:hypothetical protein
MSRRWTCKLVAALALLVGASVTLAAERPEKPVARQQASSKQGKSLPTQNKPKASTEKPRWTAKTGVPAYSEPDPKTLGLGCASGAN